MRHNKDILWKGLLEWVFDDLLRFLFIDAEKIFDFERAFGFLDKELAELVPIPENEADIRFVDKNVLRISDYTNHELAESKNPFAWVLLIAKKALLRGKDMDKKLLEGKLFIFRKLFENGVFERKKLEAILGFLNNYIRFDDPQANRIFKEQIDKITGKKNTMDIFEQIANLRREEGLEEGIGIGLEKGRQEEKENSIRIFLSHTEFDPEKIATLVVYLYPL